MIFWQDIRGWVLAGCSQRISLAFIRRISLVTIGRNSLVMARHQTLATMPSPNEKPAQPPEVLRAPEPARHTCEGAHPITSATVGGRRFSWGDGERLLHR